MFESTWAEPARPYPPDLRRGDELGLLQDADVLPHAREGHVEGLGQIRDRSVATPESLQNAASGGIRDRGEGGIESLARILNHTVQYKPRIRGIKGPIVCGGGSLSRSAGPRCRDRPSPTGSS